MEKRYGKKEDSMKSIRNCLFHFIFNKPTTFAVQFKVI